MELKERFCKKIYDELQGFQKNIMKKSKKDILDSSYKNEVFVNLYYILLGAADELSDALLSNLLNESTNILESLYSNFISDSGEDALHEELKDYVMQEFEESEEDEYSWWNNPAYMEGA